VEEIAHSEKLAEIAKEACIQAALRGYESASISGLCREGAWEAAISAIRMLDLTSEINQALVTRDMNSEGDGSS